MIMWNRISKDSKPSLLYLTTNTSTTIQITTSDDLDPVIKSQIDQTAQFDSELKIKLPAELHGDFFQKEAKAVRIKSTEPISVALFDNNDGISDDSSMIIPKSKLSTSYMVVTTETTFTTKDTIRGFGIAALDADTRINITLRLYSRRDTTRTININGTIYGDYDTFEISMNNFETFQVGSNNLDLTGTTIESSKPVAVFSGSRCNTSVDSDSPVCSQNMEQLPSTNEWDQKFILTPDIDKKHILGQICSEGDTIIETYSPTLGFNRSILLPEGRYTFAMQKDFYITSNKPILIAKLIQADITNSSIRNTYMTIVQGVDQYKRLYRLIVPDQYVENFVTITIKTSFVQDIRINRQILDPQMIRHQHYASPNSEYTYLIVQVLPGLIEVTTTSSEPFGLSMNGYSSSDAYGFEGSAIFP